MPDQANTERATIQPELADINAGLADARQKANGDLDARHEHNLALALRLAALGCPVFPCGATKKEPLVKGGLYSASCDAAVIRQWWSGSGRRGAVPGFSPAAIGLICTDLDQHPGQPKGTDEIARLADIAGEMAAICAAPAVATPNNGIHMFHQQPPGENLGNREGALKGKGINIRGRGGYVVAEGAIMADGRTYKPAKGNPGFLDALERGDFPPLAKFIADAIRAAPVKQYAVVTPSGEITADHVGFAAEKLREISQRFAATPYGSRNTELAKYVAMLGQLIPLGWINAEAIEETFLTICLQWSETGFNRSTGKFDTDRSRNALGTIRRQIAWGADHPGGPLAAKYEASATTAAIYRSAPGNTEYGDEPAPDPFGGDALARAAWEALAASHGADGLAPPPKPAAPAAAPEDQADEGGREGPGEAAQGSAIQARLRALAWGSGKPAPSSEMERCIEVALRASKAPHRTFATLATVYFMGALYSQGFRTEDNLTTIIFLLLVARSSAGKGEAFEQWARIFDEAAGRSVVKKGKLGSVESFHTSLQRNRLYMHYRADAGGDLFAIVKPANSAQVEIANKIDELFDSNNFGTKRSSPADTFQAQRRGDHAISGTRFAPGWSMTPPAFKKGYGPDSINTGIGSRLLVAVHPSLMAEIIPGAKVQREAPADIMKWIENEFANSFALTELYNDFDRVSAFGNFSDRSSLAIARNEAAVKWKLIEDNTVLVRYSPEAAALIEKIEEETNSIRMAVGREELREVFLVYARIAVQAKKLALLDSVIGKKAPSLITEKNVAWGLSFATECIASLVDWFDSGAGDGATDAKRDALVMKWINARQSKQMTLSELKKNASMNDEFKLHPFGSNEALKRTLEGLCAEGKLQREDVPNGVKYKVRR